MKLFVKSVQKFSLKTSALHLVLSSLILSTPLIVAKESSAESIPTGPRREARDELLAYLMRSSHAKKVSVVRDYLNQYRVGTQPAVINLKMAPYPRFLIGGQIQEIYPAVYDAQWGALTSEPPLDLLFDGFMQMIVDGTVEGDLKKAGDQIGPRMARQVLNGASPFCKLDVTESPAKKVSKWSLIKLKADVLNLAKPCTYRKTIFAAAKDQLIEARKKEETKEAFKAAAIQVFPKEFRAQFTTQLSAEVKDFATLVVSKFDGDLHPIWGDQGGVLEEIEGQSIENGMQNVSLFDFARGMRTDLAAAAVLKKSEDRTDRGLAAGLFYAVVNRLLYLTGGDQVKWDAVNQKMVIHEPMAAVTQTHQDTQDKEQKVVTEIFNGPWANVVIDPKTPPRFDYEAFGGWGFSKNKAGETVASNWDWGNYNPDADRNPSPIRLFASHFTINNAGLASLSSTQDLVQESKAVGELIQAVAEFMRATAPGGDFAQYFGGQDQIGDLLDPEKSMLFPLDGRKLAVGVIAALAKNLLDPKLGHVQQTGQGIQLAFRDRATLESISSENVSTEGVASLLSAAADLRESLRTDPILKEPGMESLQAVGPELETLLQLGSLALGAASQMEDGRMTPYLFTPAKGFSFTDQVSVMHSMLRAYNQTKLLLLQVSLNDAWRAMMRELPKASLSTSQKLELHGIWDDSQKNLRKQQAQAPWQAWERQLRKSSGL